MTNCSTLLCHSILILSHIRGPFCEKREKFPAPWVLLVSYDNPIGTVILYVMEREVYEENFDYSERIRETRESRRVVSRMTKIKWKNLWTRVRRGGTFISNIGGTDRHKIHNGIPRDTLLIAVHFPRVWPCVDIPPPVSLCTLYFYSSVHFIFRRDIVRYVTWAAI